MPPPAIAEGRYQLGLSSQNSPPTPKGSGIWLKPG